VRESLSNTKSVEWPFLLSSLSTRCAGGARAEAQIAANMHVVSVSATVEYPITMANLISTVAGPLSAPYVNFFEVENKG